MTQASDVRHDSPSGNGPGVDFEDRISEVAGRLRTAVGDVAESAVGGGLRPAKLVTRLDLDKSLASRIVRALRTSTSLEFAHFVPSPTGLGMFLDAAEAAGAKSDLCERARNSVEDFQAILDEFPGGRSDVEALISDSVTEVRQRNERTAKQAVYRAMSQLLGFHCETVTSALVLRPSDDGLTVDGLEVSLRQGIRRLRRKVPVTVFSINVSTRRSAGPPRIEPLRSDLDPTDPGSYLLHDFCDPTPPSVEIFRSDTHSVFALSDADASIHSPVTVASGLLIRDGWTPFRTEAVHEEGRHYLLHYPCKLLVRDLYIRDDLYVGGQPEVRIEFPTPAGAPESRREDLPERLNTLDLHAPVESLGVGMRRSAVSRVPEHAEMLARAFDSAGWDPTRFRGFRTTIAYPVPMVTTGWHIPLPSRS